MCRIPDPPKPKNCRCGHEAVMHGKCGHCYIRLVLDPFEKTQPEEQARDRRSGTETMKCSECDSISMQRVTTWGFFSSVIFLKKVEGKKPYLVRCRKCNREWKTAAEYARHLSGDAYRIGAK